MTKCCGGWTNSYENVHSVWTLILRKLYLKWTLILRKLYLVHTFTKLNSTPKPTLTCFLTQNGSGNVATGMDADWFRNAAVIFVFILKELYVAHGMHRFKQDVLPFKNPGCQIWNHLAYKHGSTPGSEQPGSTDCILPDLESLALFQKSSPGKLWSISEWHFKAGDGLKHIQRKKPLAEVMDGDNNSLQYFVFGPQYPFKKPSVNITHCTFKINSDCHCSVCVSVCVGVCI